MSNNYGDGVSRVLESDGTQFLSVIWQAGMPPLDSEYNLIGDLAAGLNRQQVLRGIPSGWLGNDVNPSKVYVTDPTWSNWFQFGRQRSGDKQSVMWANVNGWLVPVAGTQTGSPPGDPDDLSTTNRILLDPPPGSAGDARADFIFLECFRVRISPYPSTLNKPNASAIYTLGNTEGGQSYLPDTLIDPEIGEATTERVQLQYRIRVVKGLINLGTNPDGFDQAVVKAQGTQATPPSVGGYSFTNMREELGDPGLYRAGDGTENTLGTVDGYSYAIPIAIIFRKNSILWSGDPAPNLNGGFNRNPLAVDRTGTLTFSTIPTLSSDLSSAATTLSLVSATNIPLPASPTSSVYIQIDDEILTYTTITGTTVSGLIRGPTVAGTVAETHKVGSTIRVLSSRPDGLFSDQVTLTDILDLRHVVNPSGFDYSSLLRSSLDRLLKGQLRANWKKTGADPRGVYLFYEDKISATPPVGLGITQLDAPDHIRLVFSDAAVQQKVEVIAAPVTLPATLPTPGTVTWGLTIQSSILVQSVTEVWTIGDQISIPVSQFKGGVSVPDADQIRFLNDVPSSGTGTSYGTYQFIDASASRDFVGEGVEVGDIIVIVSGAAAGTYTITEVTTTVLTVSTIIPSVVSSTYVVRKGVGAVQIRVEGQPTPLAQHNFEVTPPNPGPTDDLVITLRSGTYTGGTPLNLYITTNIQYGGGRGLSRRPDSIHNIVLTNPNSQLLLRPDNYPSGNYQLSTAWTALWSKYRSDTYKSLLPVTAEAYADLGSKTIVATPFQTILFPTPTFLTGAIMPTPAIGVSDPLGLFYHSGGSESYVTLPRHLVPGWGAVYAPILHLNSSGIFNSGINFMLLSQEGTVNSGTSDAQHNQAFINYFVSGGTSCAIFSTLNLTTSLPTVYSTLYTGSFNYAGMRKFNDDPTVVGALSTARGLGRQGLELPPFYGIARLFAVYEANDYRASGSNFSILSGTEGRQYLNDPANATNLLRDNFDGPTFYIEIDANGDSSFILNADAIDITKTKSLYPISDFASGNYVIEACVFGFGRGSFDLTQPFKLALSAPLPTLIGPNAILPGPLFTSDTALVNYSRTPYQGDAWGTTSVFSDKGFTRGPLTSSDAYQLSSTELSPTGLTRPNQKPLEVLASVGIITTLGTGRLSGDLSPSNVYDIRNVGYEDPTDPAAPYPPPSGVAPRPLVKSGALSSLTNYGDLEANPEYLGCTERLPLGGLYRDKDFHGSRFSNELSSPLVYIDTAGVGSGVAGLSRTSELDQTEVLAMPAGTSAGTPGDVLVLVDGSTSDYTQLLNYRTNRGGSVFVGSGDRPGGEVFATYSRLLGSGKGNRVLVGRAFLVRNAPTLVGATQVSGGDEVMLAITTQVMELGTTPIEAMVLIGTNGSGESYSAADLYRIEGHPIIANHTFFDVDPSTIQLPLGKTIAQITAPSPTPVIPIGAANTIYVSDGVRNFWTNIPGLIGLDILDTITLGPIVSSPTGGTLKFTKYAYPLIYQEAADPGVIGATLSIASQSPVPNSTVTSTSGGYAILYSGNVTSATPGLRAESGLVQIRSGNLNSNTVGKSGDVQLTSGNNAGTGNSGAVSLKSGTASNGNTGTVLVASNSGAGSFNSGSTSLSSGAVVTGQSGNTLVSTGSVSGASGTVGVLQITGGSISNVAHTSGYGGDVVIQGGGSVGSSGSGGGVYITSGSHATSPGPVEISVGGIVRHALFTNAGLTVGPGSGSTDYNLSFSATTTNPSFGQADAITGNAQPMVIRAQSVWVGSFNGGNLNLRSGIGSSGVNGSIIFGHSLDTVVFDDNGAKFLNPSGGSNGIALQASATPPSVPSGTNGVIYTDSGNELNYVGSSVNARSISRNVIVTVATDRTDIGVRTESSTLVDIVSGWSIPFAVLSGDIVEGEAFLTTTYFGSGTANLKLICNLNSGAQVEDYSITLAPGTFKLTLPFSFLALASGSVSLTFQGASSDALPLDTLSLYYPNLLWLRARVIRP